MRACCSFCVHYVGKVKVKPVKASNYYTPLCVSCWADFALWIFVVAFAWLWICLGNFSGTSSLRSNFLTFLFRFNNLQGMELSWALRLRVLLCCRLQYLFSFFLSTTCLLFSYICSWPEIYFTLLWKKRSADASSNAWSRAPILTSWTSSVQVCPLHVAVK